MYINYGRFKNTGNKVRVIMKCARNKIEKQQVREKRGK